MASADDLTDIVDGLRTARRRWRDAHRRWDTGGRELPSRELLAGIVEQDRKSVV